MLVGNSISAAESPAPRWFNIELIVFEQYFPSGYAEHWLPTPNLQFPENLVRFPSMSSDSNVADMFKEQAFDGTLKEDLVTLKKARGQRVLFSKQWQQGLLDKENAPSIYIRGDKTINGTPELSGSINISVERYLHIRTNLWLAKFEEAKQTDNPKDSPLENISLVDQTEGVKPVRPEPTEVHLPTPYFGSQRERNSRPFNDAPLLLDSANELEQEATFASSVFLLNHNRRLRSMETHYIDHPALGVLVRIEPIKEAESTGTSEE